MTCFWNVVGTDVGCHCEMAHLWDVVCWMPFLLLSCLWDGVIPVAPVTLPTEMGVSRRWNWGFHDQGGVVAVFSRTPSFDDAAQRVGLVRAGPGMVAQRLRKGQSAAENVTSE